jgi:uroporphyrinogen III methyltransferase/synthase
VKKDKRQGVVYLVGAGPGDPDLITVKARLALAGCDVVVYDNLIPDEIVVTLPSSIERRYVGKRSHHHSLPQDEINRLLVDLASEGKRVVRLKGGDPFVFGRGGEEADYLQAHGVRYEIVPGITSGVAALAFAGIPCTDRRNASHVTFITGHKAVNQANPVRWDHVAQTRNGTIVIYMGVAEFGTIAGQLIDGGMPPDTPAAVVERGTNPTQRTVTSTLADLPAKTAEADIRPPALFVIGDVVNYHDRLKWFRDRPLFGIRVLVTRSADPAKIMYRRLRELGAEVLPYPTLGTTEDYQKNQWDKIAEVTAANRWLVFSSENSVRYFLKQWFARAGDIRGLSGYRIAAAGGGSRRALNRFHLDADLVPSVPSSAVMAEQIAAMEEISGAAVVRVRGNIEDDVVEEVLAKAGADVIPLNVYQTQPIEWTPEIRYKLFTSRPDVIIFTSGPAVDGFVSNLDDTERAELTAGATIVSIGPATSDAIASHGIRVDVQSPIHTAPALIDELVHRHEEGTLLSPPPTER